MLNVISICILFRLYYIGLDISYAPTTAKTTTSTSTAWWNFSHENDHDHDHEFQILLFYDCVYRIADYIESLSEWGSKWCRYAWYVYICIMLYMPRENKHYYIFTTSYDSYAFYSFISSSLTQFSFKYYNSSLPQYNPRSFIYSMPIYSLCPMR